MRTFLISLLAILLPLSSLLAQNMNTKIKDPKNPKREILIGYCNLPGLKSGEFGNYFQSQYETYKPSDKYIEKLKEKINYVDITVVFGSWCSDSQLQVGRFMKVLDQAGYDDKNLKIIAVDRDKNAYTTNIASLKIERVPTFIVSQHGRELGRIVETPKKSLEKDLLKIVSRAR
ncbi:MAG: thioredoxin family protein [Chlorobi bacterium]|nr:thioredoxin family protein [Chlorobiota bacterium]